MPMYKLIACSNSHSETFKLEKKKKSPFKDGTFNDVEIVVHLKYLHNFWETLEMLLINSKIANLLYKLYYFFCSWNNNIYNNW